MGVNENVLRGTKSDQLVQDLADVSAFGGTGVELAVAEGAGATLSVTVVGIRINNPFDGKLGHIHFAAFYVLAPFQYYGPEAQLEQLEGGKHTCRAGAHDEHCRRIVNVEIRRLNIFRYFFSRSVSLILITPYGFLASIHRALLEHPFHASGPGLYFF
jgi:hypothetical protein